MKHNIFYSASVTLMSLLFVACGGNTKPTLGQLKYQPEEEAPLEYENLTHKEVIDEYRDLLDEFEDEKLKENIERRIADVYLLEADNNQYQESGSSSYYVDAIKAYRNILERYPNSPDNAEVLYQLAKAYDLEGQREEAQAMLIQLTSQHPNYKNNAEAHFRLGDIFFSDQEYTRAANSYTEVANSGNENLRLNAQYMLGWSQYKLTRYSQAAASFSIVLNELFGDSDDLSGLDKRQRAVAQDTLQSVSLTLDKIGGAAAISRIEGLDQKAFTWLIYQNLGDFYKEKELYELATDSYRSFLSSDPLNPRGPQFHQRIIQTYIDGDFPKQALQEKYEFVDKFGVYSSFFHEVGVDEQTLSLLKTYLDELARHNYAQGLAKTDEIEELNKAENVDTDAIAELTSQQKQQFTQASSFYGQYLETFPNDQRYDEIVFLQAEAFFVIEQYDSAITGYEHVAYTPKGASAAEHAVDAGYAAILAYQAYIEGLIPDSVEEKDWQGRAVESMLRFSEKFHEDSRSPSVLTNAAEYLFGLNRYQQAIEIGDNLLQGNQQLDPTLAKTAVGIIAHSYFSLEDFANAQTYYFRQREYSSSESEEYSDISERLASTTYKLSEQYLAEGESGLATTELLRVKEWTPNSPIRVIAQYDAATLMLEAQQWAPAIQELKELQALFPEHELAPEFPKKLAFAHRSNENWLDAANVYLYLHEHDADDEVRREALFSAAEMFEENMSYDTAIEHYKSYAYVYEEPFDTRMEARYKLALNYEKLGDGDKSRYWMRRIIEADSEAGEGRTDRSRWLAAWAHMEYGDFHASSFREITVTLPLAKSIASKQKALADATKRYEQSAELGFLEFITQSSFKIAKLYSELSDDVGSSPRPQSLSEDDLQTYEKVLAEQSQPLAQLSIDLHIVNVERAWEGKYNEWIQKSFDALKVLHPARFAKKEILSSYGNEIR